MMDKSSTTTKGSNLRFDNQVVVITGAGGGLGRAYALFLASLGARVVVNDLGGPLSGGTQAPQNSTTTTTTTTTRSERPADVVVAEVIAGGGQAIANYDSVSDNGEAIIEAAMKHYGRIDALINNAGILRDKSFLKMTEQDWDMTLAVHLKGTYRCCKAVWPIMLRQKYGRILNISSAAGLYGNFGQASYGTAKLALVGLTKTLAIEGAKYNISCNVIAPLAGTRMTESIMPSEIVEKLRPEYIAPIAAYLVHNSCQDNGEIYECGAGWIARLRWQRSAGHVFPPNFSLDEVQREWSRVGDFGLPGFGFPKTMQDSLMMVTRTLDTSVSPPVSATATSRTATSRSSEKPGTTTTSSASDNNIIKETEESRIRTMKDLSTKSQGETIFILLAEFFKRNLNGTAANACRKAPFRYLWILTEPNKPKSIKHVYSVDMSSETGKVGIAKETDGSDATFTISEPDFVRICTSTLNPQLAFMQGKMRVKGSMKAATAFTPSLFPKLTLEIISMPIEKALSHYLKDEKKVQIPKNSRQGINTRDNSSMMTIPIIRSLQAEKALDQISIFLKSEAGRKTASKINQVYQFDLVADDSNENSKPITFTLNLKHPASVTPGPAPKPDASFKLTESDFLLLLNGKLNPRSAFMNGKLSVKGSMVAAMKFDPSLFPKIAAL